MVVVVRYRWLTLFMLGCVAAGNVFLSCLTIVCLMLEFDVRCSLCSVSTLLSVTCLQFFSSSSFI